MSHETIEVTRDADFCVVWLNRPEVRNAFNATMMAEFTDALAALDADTAVRGVVLAGRGASFCAGGDVNWMKTMAAANLEQNRAGALAMATMLNRVYAMRKPTIARVHGAAFAGGMGLIAACDIAVAADEAVFSISEVRIGLVPSTISPYVLAAIGAQAARRYFLTGEAFSAAEAHRLGLVHQVVPGGGLDAAIDSVIASLLAGGPQSQARAKRLIADIAGRPVDAALEALTARSIADARASAEGREGIAAFLEKRRPAWRRE
jgi:methylglutaconyl-CoA hydratase